MPSKPPPHSSPLHNVKAGDLGGYLQPTAQLIVQASKDPSEIIEDNDDHNYAWIAENALVFDNAKVSGNALISGNAKVYGNSHINGTAHIGGYQDVCNASVSYGTRA